jgi:hypothetical protein
LRSILFFQKHNLTVSAGESLRFILFFAKHDLTVSAGEGLRSILFFQKHNLTISAGESLRFILFFQKHNLTVSAGESLRSLLFFQKHNLTVSAAETLRNILFVSLLCDLMTDVTASELFVCDCLRVGRTSVELLFCPLYKGHPCGCDRPGLAKKPLKRFSQSCCRDRRTALGKRAFWRG